MQVSIYRLLFPSLTWKFSSNERKIYLTFDDGPIPVVTEWVLNTLKKYNAHATFFCIGDNIRKHPDVFKLLVNSSHSVGNHTMNHLNGWKTETEKYISNVGECESYVSSELFRPPYGKIKRSQISLLKSHYRIIMWDVLSKDYDQSLSGEDCLRRIKKNAGNGSIIVFHDSLKAEKRLRFALPATLEHFSGLGYEFAAIR